MCFGSGALAEYAVTGSSPIATATGIRPSSAASRSARPSLWICQCMNVERRSIFCMRYMPTLRTPVVRVLRDHGGQRDERRRVERPAALDRQQVEVHVVAGEHDLLARRLARRSSASSPRSTSASSARAPCRRAPAAAAAPARPRASAPTSSSRSTPNARHMRRSVPNWLISSGWLDPFGCSKRSAGPARLDRPVDDLGDLEVGVDLGGHADELALALQEPDPVAQVGGRCHRRSV